MWEWLANVAKTTPDPLAALAEEVRVLRERVEALEQMHSGAINGRGEL